MNPRSFVHAVRPFMSRLTFLACGAVLAAACSSTPDAVSESSGSESEALLGGLGTGGSGTVGGNKTGTPKPSCPVNSVLECGGGWKNGICILPDCVPLDPGPPVPPPPPPCGITGFACCPNGACQASYATCISGTCQLCGSVGYPACGGECNDGANVGDQCVSCNDAGVASPPTLTSSSPYSLTASLHLAASTKGDVYVTLTNTKNAADTQHVWVPVPLTPSSAVTFNGLQSNTAYTVTSQLFLPITPQTATNCAPASATATTRQCGVKGELTCTTGAACPDPHAIPSNGHCIECGRPGESACSDGSCIGGFVANGDNVCTHCGEVGELACHANPPCVDHAWAQWGQICQIACGQQGQSCCNTGSKCDDGLECSNNFFFPDHCEVKSGTGVGGNGGLTNCSAGGVFKSYPTCWTCNASGEPVDDTEMACTPEAAAAKTLSYLPDPIHCTVVPTACRDKR